MADKDSQTFFRWLLRIYVWLLEQAYGLDSSNLVEVKVKMKYNVKDDNPSVGFEVDVTDVKDAEGQEITDSQLTIDVTSSDEAIVSVSNTNGKGSVSFGNPGTASVQ